MTPVHAVLPAWVDDPQRPSGGNVYDRRMCNGLSDLGWDVTEHHVDGSWPCADSVALEQLSDAVSSIPDNAVVIVDGLIASAAAAVLITAATRVRLVVLVHLPLEVPGENEVLSSARAVITTSKWARAQLLQRYRLDPSSVHVALPGTDRADVARGTCSGSELLCVGPVSAHKGHDVLVAALTAVQDLQWRCRVVGSLDRDPAYANEIRRRIGAHGLAGRITLCGVRTATELADAYATSDLLVHPSRGETYGMVVAEALARALPVVATNVGGIPEALGQSSFGPPGLLVDSDAPADLATVLRAWLTDDRLRSRLRNAAAERRQSLPPWQSTVTQIAGVLDGLPA